jgi:urease subunit gamma/beta
MTSRGVHPGEVIYGADPVVINNGREAIEILVRNTGDRPIQVGSHFHFFEVNRFLHFERAKAFGRHLDIMAGTSVRFEPGDEKIVSLVRFGGTGNLWGFNGLTQGRIDSKKVEAQALRRARKKGFLGA